MAKFERQVRGDFSEIVEQIHSDIMNSGISMNLVDQSDFSCGDVRAAVRVYDKYFMRNGNRASLSLTVVGSGDTVFVSAIGAGGGQGVFFNFSLGAETELTEIVEQSVSRME